MKNTNPHPEYWHIVTTEDNYSATLKKYKITQSISATQVWEYEVEATSEEEAVEKACNGEIEPSKFYIDSNNDETEMEIQLIR
jgi:hypothetical protein